MAFQIGDTVPLFYRPVDPVTGVPVTPSAVAITVMLPDGTSVSPSFTNPSMGNYQSLYVAVQSGRHVVSWQSSGPSENATDAFDVDDTGSESMVSLADVKRQLNIPASDTAVEDELMGYIYAATEVCESVTGKAMVPRVFTAEEHEVTGGRCSLNWSPVCVVTDVRTIDNFVVWDVTRLHLNKQTGVLSTTFLSGLFELWGRISVTYTAGYTDLPPKYRLAAMMLVQHLWQTKRGNAGPPAPGSPQDEVYIPGIAYAIPLKVLELLGNPSPGFA